MAALLFLTCLSIMISTGGRIMSGDGDPARHIVVGEYILSTRTIPATNLFSFALADRPFGAHEWLAEVASAVSHRLLGPAGPALLHGAVVALAFGILFRHLRARGHPFLLCLATVLLAASISKLHWLARPHVFSFLGVATFGVILDGWDARRLPSRALWLLPAALCIWTNLHGGFLYGIAMIGAYAAAELLYLFAGDAGRVEQARKRLWELAAPAAASLAASLLNPAGVGLWLHLPAYLRDSLVMDVVEEWRSPDFHAANTKPFLFGLLALFSAAAWSRRRPTLPEGLLFIGFLHLALQSVRSTALFAIATAPLMASLLHGLGSSLDNVANPLVRRALGGVARWLRGRNAAYTRIDNSARSAPWVCGIFALALLTAALQFRAGYAPLGIHFEPSLQPVEAARYLRTHPTPGRGFNEQHWGGYLLYALGPGTTVFIDGEINADSEDVVRDYLTISAVQPGWEQALQRHQVDWVIYSTESALVKHLDSLPDWQLMYRDQTASVLARRSTPVS